MRATSIGHAGMLIETASGSILCDPWFVPAFFGSWFVFPRNDQLGDELLERIESADFLYVTHLHADHHDAPWLRAHLPRDIPILLPGYPTREQQRTLATLGFTEFVRTVDGEELEIAPGLTIAIHTEVSITDGPGGDSAMVVSDGVTRLVKERLPHGRPGSAARPWPRPACCGTRAIWYPMVYDMPDERKRIAAKVEPVRGHAICRGRSTHAVVPSAGATSVSRRRLWRLNIRGEAVDLPRPGRSSPAPPAGHRASSPFPVPRSRSADGFDVVHHPPTLMSRRSSMTRESYLRHYQD
jgi:UDP-MurNAc hydroxylase